MSDTDYIESGMVQDYCLGLLRGPEKSEFETALNIYPRLLIELEVTQQALENYAMAHAIEPPKSLKSQIWNTLENLNKEERMTLNNLPLITKYSNHHNWLSVVKPLLPDELNEDRVLKVIQDSGKVLQMVTMSRTAFEDEVHDDLLESFLVLEGECECYVGEDKVYHLSAGGYMQIPMHEHHDVRVLTPYVVAIIQRVAV